MTGAGKVKPYTVGGIKKQTLAGVRDGGQGARTGRMDYVNKSKELIIIKRDNLSRNGTARRGYYEGCRESGYVAGQWSSPF